MNLRGLRGVWSGEADLFAVRELEVVAGAAGCADSVAATPGTLRSISAAAAG